MKHRIVTLASTLVLVACGGKAPAPASTPAAPGSEHGETATPAAEVEHHHHDHGDESATDAEADAPTAASDPAAVKAELVASEQAAYEQARPVFEKYCARCHTQGGKKAKAKTLGHFDMTSYPFAGHHADEVGVVIRDVLGVTGKKPTMPMDRAGVVQGDELALVVAWADAFDKAHAGGAHEGDGAPHDGGGHAHQH
jgi:cytochrome c5